MADSRSFLREAFDYDLYANQLWLNCLDRDDVEDERAIFAHILSSNCFWVTRTEGTSQTEMPKVPLTEEALLDLSRRRRAVVDRLDADDTIEYTNTRGGTYSRTFSDIARHAQNHGTYHRGQLRAMLGARGLPFPETDFILYTFDRDGDPWG